ncbi:MAG: PD-(D/E)XK nuclease family protein [Endomicrobiales bacterium]|nr:PD-(D/E)XK nuclease family protein [Endomicrobiales bacterium]
MFSNLWNLLFGPGLEISYSRINAYRTCPQKYRLQYIEGKRVPPNPYISFGISIHKTLEDFHLKKNGDIDDLFESYDTCWVNEGFVSPHQAHEYFEKGRKLLENYWQDNVNLKSEVLYVEKEFSFPVGRNAMRGIIDRIDRHPDGQYEVIDYKTHSELWDQKKADADLQMSIYALACKKAIGIEPGYFSYYFLSHGTKVNTNRTDEQLEDALRTAKDVIEKVRRGVFTPNTGHCPKCDFRKSCPHSAAKRQD